MSTMALTSPGVTNKTELTPEELLGMPDGKRYELVNGVPVERTMSLLAGRVEALVARVLDAHCVQSDLGWVLGSACGYRCFAWKPKQVRRPDISFIARDRVPAVPEWSEG
jgi:hypothetical protein